MKDLSTIFSAKLANFLQVLEQQQIQRLHDQHLDCEANIKNARTSIRQGNKYIAVNVGSSTRFMVEISTETIYGTKAWNQIHKGHQYGTLDTLDRWDWSDFYPRPKMILSPA